MLSSCVVVVMSRRSVRVSDLAHEAGIDADAALVTLWDAGLDQLSGADSLVSGASVRKAQKALGLASAKESSDPRHWRAVLGITGDADWSALLQQLGIDMAPNARRLPKGAPAKLRRHARGLDLAAGVSHRTEPAVGRTPTRPTAPLAWAPVGTDRVVSHLTAEEINAIHEALVEEFAATNDPFGDPHGVRDWHLLESTSFRPQTTLGDVRKYPTPEMCGAALLHSIVHNHPFHNGNKRTGLVSMLVLLDAHDLVLVCHEDELFRFVLRVAQHGLVDELDDRSDREVLEMSRWIRSNSRRVTRGERAIKWAQLRRILANYDCELQPAPGVGNRMNITRHVVRRSAFLGRRKDVQLRTQVAYGDEGREVAKNTVHKIRTDLELTESDGVDSEAFYGDADTPRDFIFRYQKTLKRLAKL